MSEEPTTPDREEAIRRSCEAANRRDFDVAVHLFGPNAVWDTSPVGVGEYEGRQAIRRFFEDWIGTFEDWEQELEEVRDLGAGVTFHVILQRGRPAGGSEFVELRHSYTSTWAHGLVQRTTVDADIDEARAAAERFAEERE